MFTNKSADGANNICGKNIFQFRTGLGISQRELADRLQLIGLDVDKNAIQRIEAGKRFVTDIEIIAFSKVFEKTLEELLAEINDWPELISDSRFLIEYTKSYNFIKFQGEISVFYLTLDNEGASLLNKKVQRLSPKTIIVYGNVPDSIFKPYKDMGINIISFESELLKSRKQVTA